MSNTIVQIKECLEIESPKYKKYDMKNNIVHKLLSFKEVKEVAKRVLNSDIDLVEYNIRPYADGKIGFLGSHYRIDLITTKKKETVTFSLFLKVVPFDTPDHATYIIQKGIFKQEELFYSVIMPLLCEGYHEKPWGPMCYKVKENLIIFEDLGSKGYSMRDKLFDKTLVYAGLAALARLHAASLLAEKRVGISLNRLYPDIFVEKAFMHEEMSRRWFKVGVNAAAAIAERLGHDPNLVQSGCEEIYHALKPSCTKANVVSHGDIWANNLMFNDDVSPKCLLVDYQLLRYAPLAHDVAQFLYLCTDRSFREKYEGTMLQYYYETLCEILHAHNIHMRKPSWSELIEGMEEQRLAAVITAILYFPTVLMDKKLSAEIMDNPVSYSEYCFHNRERFIFANMEEDITYKRRINETATELVELASRLDQLPKPS